MSEKTTCSSCRHFDADDKGRPVNGEGQVVGLCQLTRAEVKERIQEDLLPDKRTCPECKHGVGVHVATNDDAMTWPPQPIGVQNQAQARFIFDDGIPELFKRQGKPSSGVGAAQRPNHDEAAVVERKLDALDPKTTVASHPSQIWREHDVHGLNWQTEATLVRFISMIIKDVIEALGLAKKVQIHDEITVTSLRPDLWVFFHNMIPIGALAVKVPAEKSPLKAPRVLGQVYDYLQMLRSFFYCQNAIAIATTYDEWMVCWLNEECFKEGQDSTPQTPFQPNDGSERRSPPKTPSQGADVHKPPLRRSERLMDPAVHLEEPEDRKFFSSPVLKWNDRDTVGVIARAIQEMVRGAPHRAPMVPNKTGRLVIKMTADQWSWVKFPCGKESLPYGVYPDPKEKEFLLLEEIGRSSAAEGRVWLACDKNVASVCVLKFSKGDNSPEVAQSRLATEAKNWTTLYPPEQYDWCFAVRVVVLDSRPALLMPHFSYVPEEERTTSFIDKILSLYSVQFVKRDLVHQDLRWANIAAVKNDSGGLEPLILDLSEYSIQHLTVTHDEALHRAREQLPASASSPSRSLESPMRTLSLD